MSDKNTNTTGPRKFFARTLDKGRSNAARKWPRAARAPEGVRLSYGAGPLLLAHPQSAVRLLRYLAIGWFVSSGWRIAFKRLWRLRRSAR